MYEVKEMQIFRVNTGIYTNKVDSKSDWKYRFVMDDFGNAILIEKSVQNYRHSIA